MRSAFPHPVLAACLVLMWLLLTRFSLGNLILGTGIAVVASYLMSHLQMPTVRLRNWGKIIRLALIVGVDIIRSNIAVAKVILAGPNSPDTKAGFMEVQLRIRDRHAIALLAIILTATPGTAWVEFDPNSGRLMLHVLDLVDPEEWQELIKNRYEAMLMEIFE
ncbi:MAG: Na+/H+ antiporter subunit E [Paracoccus sp. (in: a-proteobacteria)]|nr:Na+/H+ antiporter subunit E [Paracoccus sp. (in: a-proteobacteria)]